MVIAKSVKRLRKDIMDRCYNPKSIMYEKYGGRGIKVCEEWHDFEKFRLWTEINGFDGTQRIIRLDSTQDYCPQNCMLSTKYMKKENVKKSIEQVEQLKSEPPFEIRRAKNGRIIIGGNPLHARYHSMRQRCENPKNKGYAKYGARGIKVCDEWRGRLGEANFLEWALKSGFREGLQIDRIDNNGDYSPQNCRWASVIEQQNNRRGNRVCMFGGQEKTIADIAREIGIPYNKALALINKLDVKTKIIS